MLSAAKWDLESNDDVLVNYHLNGNLFSIRRKQAPTKVSQERINELRYADDATIVLQRNINVIDRA